MKLEDIEGEKFKKLVKNFKKKTGDVE